MERTEPGWELYRSFLAVLAEGSLSGAARALGLTQPTIGRHVEALEQALGLALFTRSPHGLIATEAALELRGDAERMAAAADALRRIASGQRGTTSGTVRITASEIIGGEVLPAILTRIHATHPGLALELVLSNRTEDLLQREADIAVRMVRPSQDALLAQRIGEVRLGLHAHRDYLARRGQPATVDELGAHALIGFDHDTAFVRRVRARGVPLERTMFALRTDSDLAQLAALRAGFGIGVCQRGIALRDAHLVPVLPGAFAFSLEMWVAMHEDLRASRRFRVVFDALVESLSAYVASAS